MHKKLVLLVLALAAVAAASFIPPAAATPCGPNQVFVDCGNGYTLCCYKWSVCICPAE